MILNPIHVIFPIVFTIVAGSGVEESSTKYAEDTLEQTYGKIIYASVLFRHGDRTPVHPYPKDEIPPSIWVQGIGQLTRKGKDQVYQLGKWLRKRYDNLLNSGEYRWDMMRVNSSDQDRTLMSAELVLAGMFPPTKLEVWTDEISDWQPIPVHTVPSPYDNMLELKAHCERHDFEKSKLNILPDFRAKFYDPYAELFAFAEEKSGFPLPKDDIFLSLKHIGYLYDDFLIEEWHNFTLPPWSKALYPQPGKKLDGISFGLNAYTHQMKRLASGPLIGAMVKDMLLKRDTEFNQTLHLYSAHDTTIAPFLNSFEIYNWLPPPLASAVLVEMRIKNGEYIVTISYRNSTTEAPYLLKILDCGELCTLDEFVELTRSLIPEDWHDECQVGMFEKLLLYVNLVYVLLLIFVSLAFVILIVIIIRLHWMRRQRYNDYEHIKSNIVNNMDAEE